MKLLSRGYDLFQLYIVIVVLACIGGALAGIAKLMQWFTNTFLAPAEPVGFWLCLAVSVFGFVILMIYMFAKIGELNCDIKRRFPEMRDE